eukprot:1531481-Prymnesium_polylepis.1
MLCARERAARTLFDGGRMRSSCPTVARARRARSMLGRPSGDCGHAGRPERQTQCAPAARASGASSPLRCPPPSPARPPRPPEGAWSPRLHRPPPSRRRGQPAR